MKELLIHVEGEDDKCILSKFFSVLGINNNIEYFVHNGKNNIRKYLKNSYRVQENVSQFILIDSDEYNVPDSQGTARKQLGVESESIKVFCAVPCIEAWLFADIKNLINNVEDSEKKAQLERFPLPESIPYPKQTFFNLFNNGRRNNKSFDFVFNSIDINQAVSRSPSLRVFLNSILDDLDLETFKYEKILKNSIPRDVFATLLQELPKEKIVWKTLDGNTFNALELSKEIENGTDLGKQYISDLLRIARDMLARKAEK
ncbi:DUF4276 family protein [Acinetobacter kyonggiensis]|uniref:DUF4276 family protein n=1 Tax=Acinetobacter kyonggiensis TaxID=595670 RepID=A0A1H3KMV8_9GAMM|nr:DUF4276 family protein [Acinetobacter kyonggiensis]SDY53481.1 protein of unknown function [Acinetobacter kyonggiensis]